MTTDPTIHPTDTGTDRLRELSEAATPGEWKATRSDPAEGADCWWLTSDQATSNMEKDLGSMAGGWPRKRHEANAQLVVSLVNAYRSGELVHRSIPLTSEGAVPVTKQEIVTLIAKHWLTAKGASEETATELSDPAEFPLLAPEDYAACCEVADALLHRLSASPAVTETQGGASEINTYDDEPNDYVRRLRVYADIAQRYDLHVEASGMREIAQRLKLVDVPALPAGTSESPWSEHSPAEIVRRTRCQAEDAAGRQGMAGWRMACDLILQRLGALPPSEQGGSDA
jgi:hypothetical protein